MSINIMISDVHFDYFVKMVSAGVFTVMLIKYM